MHRIRGKLTYSNVVSTLCLVLLLGGGTAYAASNLLPKGSVGTKQLAQGAVTPAKLSKSSKATLTGPTGAAGATGAQGVKGDRGEKGDPGPAGPITGTLPAGVTLRGVFNLDTVASTTFQYNGGSISFDLALATAPHRETTFVPTANCPGSAGEPAAASGWLCVYPGSAENLHSNSVTTPTRYGAELFAQATGTGRFYWAGTWAVTGD